jgi:heme exporter protein A
MPLLSVQCIDVKKVFNRRVIFQKVNFTAERGAALAITGRNGSGKSTLVKILSGILSPANGQVIITVDGTTCKREEVYKHIGLVSPYLQLYDEFSGYENLKFASDVRGLGNTREWCNSLLERVNLLHRKNDEVRTYSSGMKQRLKYAFALLHRPPILILDEPTSNLDAEGVAVIRSVMEEQKQNGILIVATNDADDVQYCNQCINLDEGKK